MRRMRFNLFDCHTKQELDSGTRCGEGRERR
jgi:hypothetical protein